MKLRIYFKRQITSPADVISCLKALEITRSKPHRCLLTKLVFVDVVTDQTTEYIEQYIHVAFVEEI